MTFTVLTVSMEQNEEFQESRVHYTLAGIKSLLKIGEGGGSLMREGRFQNPWNPPLATLLVHNWYTEITCHWWSSDNQQSRFDWPYLLLDWMSVLHLCFHIHISYSTTVAAFFSSAFFGALLTDSSKEKYTFLTPVKEIKTSFLSKKNFYNRENLLLALFHKKKLTMTIVFICENL